LEVLAPDEFYRPGAQEALVDRVLDEGYPALRISGEATTAHEVLTPGAHREVEDLVERLCASRPVSALCQYAARSVPGAALDDVVSAHPAGVRELSLGTRGSAGRLELRGSVDVTNVDVLRASLVAALSAARGAPALRVDLSGVEHLAAAACRTIVADSAPARASGQRLLLEGARPVVDLVLRLCHVDADGVEIVGHSR
jgi:anti-sigma B factor antagonist